jgi:hypothetical protein
MGGGMLKVFRPEAGEEREAFFDSRVLLPANAGTRISFGK